MIQVIIKNARPLVLGLNKKSNTIDPATAAWVTATGITDPILINAVNVLVLGLKANSLWSKMRRIYPFLGGNSGACAVDLVTATAGTFGGSFTFSASGPLPNGVNAFFDTGLNATTLTANNNHLGFDSYTNNAVAVDYDMGVATNGLNGVNLQDVFLRRPGNSSGFDAGTFSSGRTSSTTTTDSAAYFIGSIVANNNRKMFRAGTEISSSSTTFSQTLPNGNIYIFALNGLEVPGASYFGSKGCRLATIGDGLTPTEVSTLTTLRNTLQTSTGR